jgi:uncharacterized protein (DUF1800 family)
MGDENTILSEADARHLLRRAGFGATRAELDRSGLVGLSRGDGADRLLGYRPSGFKPGGRDQEKQHDKWIGYMLKSKTPVQEKLVLFWHDHFSTGIAKLFATNFDDAIRLMGSQNQLIRLGAKGHMKDLVKAIGRDAAMMEFLDTVRNHKEIPNENYARELLELFTLGVFDSAGNENYTQADIVQIARAFTGWDYDDRGNAFLDQDDHDFAADFMERGPKEIFGQPFDVNGEGEAEIDTVVDIIFTLTDSSGFNTVARRTARRLLEYYVGPNPSLAVIDAVVASSGFVGSWSIEALLRAIFCHDAFYATALPFGPGVTKSVKWPVDVTVSTLRLLGMKLKGREKYVPGGDYAGIFDRLEGMGQILLDPPSVFGWDWETSWLSSSTLLARYGFARDIVAARGGGRFRPDKLIDFGLTDPGDIVDAVLDALDVAHNFTSADRQECIDYITDDGGTTPDLNDYDFVNTKLHGLFELVMKSPAYQVY